MKHAVIVAHPDPESFNLTMAHAYEAAATRAGDQVTFRDLYRVGFDPRLQACEVPRPSGFAAAPDVVAERGLIGDADVFVFVYPLWFNSPPAMLKGYIERVFGMGFGYGPEREGNTALLTGRKLVAISSSGAPKEWVVETGAWAAIRNLFDEHVASVCGLSVVDHLHFGGVEPGETPDAVKALAAQVAEMFERRFGPAKTLAV